MALGRAGRIGGAVFGLAYLAHLLVFTRNYDTAGEVASYFRDQQSLIFVGALVSLVGAAGVAVFFGHLVAAASASGASRRSVAVLGAGATLGVCLLFVSLPIHAGVGATIAEDIDPDLFTVLMDLSHWHVAYAAAGFAVAIAVVASASTLLHLSPWLGRLSWVTAASCALYVVATPLILFLPVWALGIALGSRRGLVDSANA